MRKIAEIEPGGCPSYLVQSHHPRGTPTERSEISQLVSLRWNYITAKLSERAQTEIVNRVPFLDRLKNQTISSTVQN